MSFGYRIAYRLGLTPWEQAGVGFGPQLAALLDEEQRGRSAPFGAALDIGCGTGDHAIELARRGWQVTGIDFVATAVTRARAKASDAGVEVRFLEGDATRLQDAVGSDQQLLLDVGCFHGFTPAQRAAYAQSARAVTAPGGVLLMFAFGPGRRGPLPRGVGKDELLTTFSGWTLDHDEAANTEGMPGPLKKSRPRWYRMLRGA